MCAGQHTQGSLLPNREDTDGVHRHPISVLALSKKEVDGGSLSRVPARLRLSKPA